MGLRGPEGPQTPFRSPKPWLWWLQPAPNTSPQIPARRELHIQSLGLQPTSWIISTPHPEPAPLLLPRFLSLHPGVPGPCSLPPPQPPGPPRQVAACPRSRLSHPLQPPVVGAPAPLTQARRQRLLVGPHGPLDLSHGDGTASTTRRSSDPSTRCPRAPPASSSAPSSPSSGSAHHPAPARVPQVTGLASRRGPRAACGT